MATIDDIAMKEVSECIRRRIGLYFPPAKYGELRYKLTELSKEAGFRNTDEYILKILNNNADQLSNEILAAKLSIGESYFWRDRELFRLLEDDLFPQLLKEKKDKGRNLRIWSAGCSSGEEPYSIAILLSRLLLGIKDWNISIIATDINQIALQKAQKGLYTEWSFRSSPQWLKKEYFNKSGENEYLISDRIKSMVDFNYLNLFEDVYPSLVNHTNGLDMIFCRNVLMYFAPEDIKIITEKFYHCLSGNGIFMTTPTETFHFISPLFKQVNRKNVSYYIHKEHSLISDSPKPKEQTPEKPPDLEITPRARAKREQIKAKYKQLQKSEAISKMGNQGSLEMLRDFYAKGMYLDALRVVESEEFLNQNEEVMLLYVRILANLGKLKMAMDSCDKLMHKNKLNANAYYLKGVILAELGEIEKAEKAMKGALYINPDFIIPHFNLAVFAINKAQYKKAKKYFNTILILLNNKPKEDIIPESDGITAGRLKEMIDVYIKN